MPVEGCEHLRIGDELSMHEYEDGRCVLFDGRKRIADIEVRQ